MREDSEREAIRQARKTRGSGTRTERHVCNSACRMLGLGDEEEEER